MRARRNQAFQHQCERCQIDRDCTLKYNCARPPYMQCPNEYHTTHEDYPGHIWSGCRCGQDATEEELKKNKCKYFRRVKRMNSLQKCFKKMYEAYEHFLERVFKREKKIQAEKSTLTDDYKFIDVIEVPYKDRTYDAELWWSAEKEAYRAITLNSDAQRFDDLKATIVIDCPVRSRKKVEQMMVEQIDKYFEGERYNK